jgi:dTDP-4-dehydrorhamnose reductase
MVRTHNPECAFHHISTGCFFSGDCEHPEDAAPNNLRGTYLHTKWHSEAVAKIAPKQAIWRIRLPFDGRLSEPRNLLAKLRRFTVLSDGRESTTYLPDLADAILLHGHLAVGGLWHATNPEPQTLHYMGLCLGRDIPVGETGLARSHTTLSTEALRSALGDHYPFRTTREALWAAFCC